MQLVYISHLDKYLASNGKFYTDDDLDMFIDEEKRWKDNQPRYSFGDLMTTFPEAVKPARRALKKEMKWLNQRLSAVNDAQEDYQNNRINKAHFSKQAELKRESDRDFDEARKRVVGGIKKVMFKLSYLDQMEGKETVISVNGVTEADIERVKQTPIESVYTDKLRRNGRFAVGSCPFHPEKNGSFTIYLNQNSFYCYSCNFGGSVIDFVMKQQDTDFLSAVKLLLK